jgi:flagellar hook assembly protein FlgD
LTITPTPDVPLTLSANFFTPPQILGMDVRVDSPGQVKITVFNIAGQKVKRILDQNLPAGLSQVTWDGTNDAGTTVGSGLYLVVIQAPGSKMVRKVIVLR